MGFFDDALTYKAEYTPTMEECWTFDKFNREAFVIVMAYTEVAVCDIDTQNFISYDQSGVERSDEPDALFAIRMSSVSADGYAQETSFYACSEYCNKLAETIISSGFTEVSTNTKSAQVATRLFVK